MSNSRPVSETELDSNSEYETEHTTNKGTHNTGSSNTTKGLVTQPEYERTTTDSSSKSNISKDSVAQSEYEHTYVHSLKTLAYLAWVGWLKPKEPSPNEDIAKTCECGCIVDGIGMPKPHFRVRK